MEGGWAIPTPRARHCRGGMQLVTPKWLAQFFKLEGITRSASRGRPARRGFPNCNAAAAKGVFSGGYCHHCEPRRLQREWSAPAFSPIYANSDEGSSLLNCNPFAVFRLLFCAFLRLLVASGGGIPRFHHVLCRGAFRGIAQMPALRKKRLLFAVGSGDTFGGRPLQALR
jgi:hypothetical protein